MRRRGGSASRPTRYNAIARPRDHNTAHHYAALHRSPTAQQRDRNHTITTTLETGQRTRRRRRRRVSSRQHARASGKVGGRAAGVLAAGRGLAGGTGRHRFVRRRSTQPSAPRLASSRLTAPRVTGRYIPALARPHHTSVMSSISQRDALPKQGTHTRALAVRGADTRRRRWRRRRCRRWLIPDRQQRAGRGGGVFIALASWDSRRCP